MQLAVTSPEHSVLLTDHIWKREELTSGTCNLILSFAVNYLLNSDVYAINFSQKLNMENSFKVKKRSFFKVLSYDKTEDLNHI